MKNRFVKIFALLLALAISLSALAACSSSATAKKKKKKSNKKNNATVSSEYSSTEDELSDYIEDDEFYDEFEEEEEEPEEDEAEPDDGEEDDEMDSATVSVFNADPVQNNFLGFNAVYSAFTFQSDMYGRQLTEEMAQLETDRAIELGVRIARTIYYLRDNWDSKTNSFSWENETMQAMYKWANKLKTGNVDVFIGGPGGYMLQNYHWSVGTVEGEPTTVHASIADPENNQQKVYENFGNVMAKIVKAFHQHGATNVKYVGTDTEPPTHWKADWGTEEERLQWISERAASTAAAMNEVHRALQREGLRNVVSTIGPNVTSATTDDNCIQYLKFYQQKVEKGACDHISLHNYYGNNIETDNYELWTERIDQALTVTDNENLIWDEYGLGCGGEIGVTYRSKSGLYGYQMALADMAFLNKGLKSAFMWSLFDQQFPNNTANAISDSWSDGVQQCGCMPTLLRSSYVYPYYHYVNLVNNIMGQSGAAVYAGDDSCEDGVYAAMTKGPDGSYNIMVVNTNLAEVKVTLNFEKSLNNATLYRHVYDPNKVVATDQTHITAVDKKIVHTNKILVDTVVPYGVSFYTTRRIAK